MAIGSLTKTLNNTEYFITLQHSTGTVQSLSWLPKIYQTLFKKRSTFQTAHFKNIIIIFRKPASWADRSCLIIMMIIID